MDVLAYLVAAVVNVALVSFVVRRLLGVPVGWPRTIVLTLLIQGASSGLLAWVGQTLDLDTSVNSPTLGQTFAILSLVIAWLIAAQVAILTVLEVFVPTGTVPGPLALIRSLPARRRRAARYTAIVRIAAQHGLGAYLRPTASGTDQPASKVARSLRLALTDGGVTFVKLGQMLSSRADLLPEAYTTELSSLQDRVPAQPWGDVEVVLERELGRPVSEVFTHIDQEPMAAASVGQVHRAILRTGEEVVVKVQRRGARRQVTADLDIILRLGAWLERTTGWGRLLGTRTLAEGFAASLDEELDYRVELANMRAVGSGLAATGRNRLRVPRAHESLCSERVLVMDCLQGRPVGEAEAALAGFSADERRAMADDLLGAVLHQIVVSGVFHADLHPGNIFVGSDGTLGLLDFGAVGRLDQSARTSIGLLLAAVDRQDAIAAADALLDLLDRTERVDDRRLERDLGQLMLRYTAGPGGGATGSAAMFVELFRLVLRHGLAVPPQVAGAFRALGALEGSLRLISPDLDVVAAARSHGRGLVASSLTPTQARATLESQLATVLPMLQRLPRRVNKISEDLEAGRFSLGIRAFADPGDRAFLTGIVHQVILTALAMAATLGGIILIAVDRGPMMTGQVRFYAFLGFTLVFFGFIMASRVLALVFHQHRATVRGG